MRPNIEFDEKKHKYTVNGEEFPSVTKIINLVVPKDLSWWGMRVGISGTTILHRRGQLTFPLDPDRIEKQLTEYRLTTNHIKEDRGRSGTSIHKAFEDYGKTERIPNLDDFPRYDHPRIQYLCDWLLQNRPEFIEQEVRTASLEYRYAGTFDARVKFARGDYRDKIGILDLKTSKYVYPESHFTQLEAYEHAEVEAGCPASDERFILHVPDYQASTLHRSLDTIHDFLVLLPHYQSVMDRRERLKEEKKIAKAAARAKVP